MREITRNEATEIKAGAAADAHIKRYPAHAKRVSVFYCEKNH